MMKTHILLEESPIYNDAMEVGELIWDWVSNWDAFAKHTVGNQIVRSADSIAANFAEGYGRFFFKDRKQFCYYSRGSLKETQTWARKAFRRQLIQQNDFDAVNEKLQNIHHLLNLFIKKLKEQAV